MFENGIFGRWPSGSEGAPARILVFLGSKIGVSGHSDRHPGFKLSWASRDWVWKIRVKRMVLHVLLLVVVVSKPILFLPLVRENRDFDKHVWRLETTIVVAQRNCTFVRFPLLEAEHRRKQQTTGLFIQNRGSLHDKFLFDNSEAGSIFPLVSPRWLESN